MSNHGDWVFKSSRVIDLDYLGTVFSKDPAADWTSKHLAEVEYTDPGKWWSYAVGSKFQLRDSAISKVFQYLLSICIRKVSWRTAGTVSGAKHQRRNAWLHCYSQQRIFYRNNGSAVNRGCIPDPFFCSLGGNDAGLIVLLRRLFPFQSSFACNKFSKFLIFFRCQFFMCCPFFRDKCIYQILDSPRRRSDLDIAAVFCRIFCKVLHQLVITDDALSITWC